MLNRSVKMENIMDFSWSPVIKNLSTLTDFALFFKSGTWMFHSVRFMDKERSQEYIERK